MEEETGPSGRLLSLSWFWGPGEGAGRWTVLGPRTGQGRERLQGGRPDRGAQDGREGSTVMY